MHLCIIHKNFLLSLNGNVLWVVMFITWLLHCYKTCHCCCRCFYFCCYCCCCYCWCSCCYCCYYWCCYKLLFDACDGFYLSLLLLFMLYNGFIICYLNGKVLFDWLFFCNKQRHSEVNGLKKPADKLTKIFL